MLEGAKAGGRPVWLSVTVSDTDGGRLRSGEPVTRVETVAKKSGAAAILANCSAPEAITQTLTIIRDFGLPFGAYANGFRRITEEFLKDSPTVDALEARPEMTPARYADFAMQWIGLGATIVGGCCETTPAHIARIARYLREAGDRIA